MTKRLPRLDGLGDVVEAVAKATGKDCGCKRRRDKLNEMFPFRGGRDGVHTDQA
jgi:hypothetical protein